MIKSLRKRHGQAWMLLALVLPIGILFSWLVIPNQQPVQLLQAQAADTLPVIEYTIDKPAYTIHIRTNAQHTARQLEWVNKQSLTVPSAVIYQLKDTAFNKVTDKLIGRIEARGNYRFALDIPGNNKMKSVSFFMTSFINKSLTISTLYHERILFGRWLEQAKENL